MKKIFGVLFSLFLVSFLLSAQSNIEYYLPEKLILDTNIPTPEEITGYEIGNWHYSHDQLLLYAREVAKSSERVAIFEYALSWENRPLVYLVFTDPENHKKLDQIRENHIQTSKYGNDPDPELPLPVIVHLGYGVHGNESSASNSSLLTIYYLASTQEEWVSDFLKENIIIVDPCLNPDGFNRHSTWINMNRSQTLVSDPEARGFNEPWPGARTNHYWFDLNRDYILF
jgi:hypothetical protein